jgi:hypothetical protein
MSRNRFFASLPDQFAVFYCKRTAVLRSAPRVRARAKAVIRARTHPWPPQGISTDKFLLGLVSMTLPLPSSLMPFSTTPIAPLSASARSTLRPIFVARLRPYFTVRHPEKLKQCHYAKNKAPAECRSVVGVLSFIRAAKSVPDGGLGSRSGRKMLAMSCCWNSIQIVSCVTRRARIPAISQRTGGMSILRSVPFRLAPQPAVPSQPRPATGNHIQNTYDT